MCQELVSIIVPVYNAEKYLDRCVRSILHQTYPSIEVILVDDGSTDDSLSICERYADEYPNVKIFHTENHGPSSARNFGIEQASGQYIQFADSDDYLELDMVEKMVEAKKTSQADLVLCGFSSHVGDDCESFIPDGGFYDFSAFQKFLSYWTFNFISASQCGKLFERNVILNNKIRCPVGVFYAEDCSFCLEYISYCESFFVIPLALYHYNVDTPDSLTKISFINLDELWNSELLVFDYMLRLLDAKKIDPFESIAAQQMFSSLATVNFYQRIMSKGIFHGVVWARQTVHSSPYRLLIKKTKKISRARGLNYVFYLLKLIV